MALVGSYRCIVFAATAIGHGGDWSNTATKAEEEEEKLLVHDT